MISRQKNVIGENESVISEQMTRVVIRILLKRESDFGSFSSASEWAEDREMISLKAIVTFL